MITKIKFELKKDLFLSYEEATEQDFHLAEKIIKLNDDSIRASIIQHIRDAEKRVSGINLHMYFKIPVIMLTDSGNVHSLEFYIREFDSECVWIGLCKAIPKTLAA